MNRQALYNLESGSNLPSIRTIEAICREIDLDPLIAIGAGLGATAGKEEGGRHMLKEMLGELSGDALSLAIDFIKLLQSRSKSVKPVPLVDGEKMGVRYGPRHPGNSAIRASDLACAPSGPIDRTKAS
ncbi:MAG: hypothetical protein ABWY00_16515 [Dongiaceae bacterium]